MESLSSKESSLPPSGIPVYFMCKNYGLQSYKCLQKWHNLTKNKLKLQWPLRKTFQVDKIIYLRNTLESKAS